MRLPAADCFRQPVPSPGSQECLPLRAKHFRKVPCDAAANVLHYTYMISGLAAR